MIFGAVGFYLTAAISGLVSSAGATASTISLYRTGSLSYETAVVAILLANESSLAIKAALAATGPEQYAYQTSRALDRLLLVTVLSTAVVLTV